MGQVFVFAFPDEGEVTAGSGVDATGTLSSLELTSGGGIISALPIVSDWTLSDPPEFGTVTLSATTGSSIDWTYDLDDTNPAVQDLVLGETLTDTFVVTADPTTGTSAAGSQEITITIFGVCFANGTLIETDTGLVSVEDLQPGQMVMTRDAGLQPIIWLGGGECSEADWRRDRRLLPVRIRADAFGQGCPARDLFVSQNHRILLRGARAELFFGEAEVLVAAKYLCSLSGVDIVKPSGRLSYHHILFERHHILTANGCPAESLLLGDEVLVALAPDDLMSLDEILRETTKSRERHGRMARACRRVLSRVETRLMLTDALRATQAVPA